MAFAFLRKLVKKTGPKPIPVPKMPPAYTPPTAVAQPPGYFGSKGLPDVAKFASPTVHIPGTYRPEYRLPTYTPRQIEGLEDVELAPTYGPKKEVKLGRGRSPIGGSVGPVDQGEEWLPKYPGFAHPNRDLYDLHDEGGAWIPAPAASHLESFRFLPAKVRAKTPWKAVIAQEDRDMIDIRFKPNGRNGTWEYRYWFPPDQSWLAHEIWGMLLAAEHPGEIVHEYLIGLRILYKRVGQQ